MAITKPPIPYSYGNYETPYSLFLWQLRNPLFLIPMAITYKGMELNLTNNNDFQEVNWILQIISFLFCTTLLRLVKIS